MMNQVDPIFWKKKFLLDALDEKIKIKILRRLMPDLQLTQVIKKKTCQFTTFGSMSTR